VHSLLLKHRATQSRSIRFVIPSVAEGPAVLFPRNDLSVYYRTDTLTLNDWLGIPEALTVNGTVYTPSGAW
jgi:hypothetical protein